MQQTGVRRTIAAAAAAMVAGLVLPGLTTAGVPALARQSEQPGAGTSPRLLGVLTLPDDLRVDGTTVGGLSGIERDPRTGDYALISDDRSEHGPARFYTADLEVDLSGPHDVRFTGTHPLRRPDGQTYPTLPQWQAADCPDSPQVCDQLGPVNPESIRFDPRTEALTWSQEGINADPTLLNPSIRQTGRDGTFLGQLPLPDNEHFSTTPNTGPRGNQTLESVTYAADGGMITSALEGPLGQDGAPPTPQEGALTRITQQTRAGEVLAQYAYPLDPLFATPTGTPGRIGGLVGVADLVAADPTDPSRYLLLQRSYATGHGYNVRIYRIDTTGATDISTVPALAGHPVTPVRKELVADLGALGLPQVGNLEGITRGPVLPTGENTLLLVSDNNFSAEETTQIVALAVP